jgi:hypothetical protein
VAEKVLIQILLEALVFSIPYDDDDPNATLVICITLFCRFGNFWWKESAIELYLMLNIGKQRNMVNILCQISALLLHIFSSVAYTTPVDFTHQIEDLGN